MPDKENEIKMVNRTKASTLLLRQFAFLHTHSNVIINTQYELGSLNNPEGLKTATPPYSSILSKPDTRCISPVIGSK
ncbi:hypothetical protein V9J84_003646 [Vibrio cholerae]|nr:hypothetical protein [Vibrio cholerae]ELJ8480329.1 hypothetical protein [Vibrio cholerae]HDI3228343.1 hypothetical protein [Vibrio cholerae]